MTTVPPSLAAAGEPPTETDDGEVGEEGDSSSPLVKTSLDKSISESIRQRPIPRDWIVRLLKRFPTPNCYSLTKALVVAPMVDQSDLPYRLLCRRYGANLCFTPMIHAKLFQINQSYKRKFFNLVDGTPLQDRPLIAQLCGSQPLEFLIKTAQEIQPFVDGIDLNCGCPQNIAKRGHYGAFLLEQPDALLDVVKALTSSLDIPVSVKARLLPSGVDDSLKLYERFVEEGGISLLTIHGRNRLQKAELTGHADWDAIKRAVELLGDRIPIFANGSISSLEDVQKCLDYTGADGVMSSEAILEYPPLFSPKRNRIGRLSLARQYIELAKQYPPEKGGQGSGLKCIRVHLHRFLHADLQQYTNFRDQIVNSNSFEEFETTLDDLEKFHIEINHDPSKEKLSWYMRHRKVVDMETGMTAIEAKRKRERAARCTEESPDEAPYCMAGFFMEQ